MNFPGQVESVVREFDAGRVAVPSTGKAVADAIVELRDAADRDRIGANARRLSEAYDRHAMAARFEEVLVGVLDQHPPKRA